MTTLLPIPEDGIEALKNGEVILLKDGDGNPLNAVCAAEDYPEAVPVKWERDDCWNHFNK